MELLAGEPKYLVEAHESGCRFRFDFSNVYWNSRLYAEHERLVHLFKPGEVIADVFAGVGPFAIPAAKKGCGILANDLNPSSFEYLNVNIRINSVESQVKPTMLDGAEFIKRASRQCWDDPFFSLTEVHSKRWMKLQMKESMKSTSDLRLRKKNSEGSLKRWNSPGSFDRDKTAYRRISHFVMNLPDSAIDFLPSFKGAFDSISSESNFNEVYEELPMIHCYCFTRETEVGNAEKDIRSRIENILEMPMEKLDFHFVRSVAPNKDMYCVSFRLPASIAIQV